MSEGAYDNLAMPEVTRIDFTVIGDGVLVQKWGVVNDSYNPRSIVVESDVKQGFDLQSALAWCSTHGWTVHTWPGGARAWKGEPYPIRDARTIQRKRAELTKKLMLGQTDGTTGSYAYDLAYDL